MRFSNHIGILICFIILISSCDYPGTDPRIILIEPVIAHFKDTYAPDKRVGIFDISAVVENEKLTLKGETNLPEAQKLLEDSLTSRGIVIENAIAILPDTSLGSNIYALVNNSVANLRSHPKHSAELATQALLGMPLKVLKQEGDFYLVQSPDQYIAWVDHGGIVRMNKEALSQSQQKPKILYTEIFGYARQSPSPEAPVVADLALGNMLQLERIADRYYEVVFPDGRNAFVSIDEAETYANWIQHIDLSPQSFINVSHRLLGFPYLWGGTSSKGMDCSGFTKTVYYLHGMILPRDASQQVHSGELVDDQQKFDQLKVGDLLFFGKAASDSTSERVTHVGMWIGNDQFIHASGRVRISSVNSDSPLYDEKNIKRYLRTKRILSEPMKNVQPLASYHPL